MRPYFFSYFCLLPFYFARKGAVNTTRETQLGIGLPGTSLAWTIFNPNWLGACRKDILAVLWEGTTTSWLVLGIISI